jgi:triosephosphate isomerase (TIM)
MAHRKKLIVGNWKMNLGIHEASLFVHHLSKLIPVHRDVEIVLTPTTLALQPLSLQIDRRQFKLAAQNFYWRDHGAFTGEVSAAQLRGLVDYAIVGHSERRHVFHEHDKDIRSKVQAAIRNHIRPILCIGETAHERSEGETKQVLHDQLVGGLANITSEELDQVVVAYEPVWAISNGSNFSKHQTPTPHDLRDAQTIIRSQIRHLYGDKASQDVRILYGGSVSADNASAYLGVDGIDGLLVGGASLNEQMFAAIVASAHAHSDEQEKHGL